MITIQDGDIARQDPNDKRVYRFDWGTKNLAAGVSITNSSWTLTAVSGGNSPALSSDNAIIMPGSRDTRIRIMGGQAGTLYKIDNQIDTDESPSQTKNRHFFIQIEDE